MKYLNVFILEEVLRDRELTSLEKLILIHIVSLCKKKDYCWASNRYFKDIYSVSIQTISKCINNLVKKGYLESNYNKYSINISKRKITLSKEFNNKIKSIKENFNTGIKVNFNK